MRQAVPPDRIAAEARLMDCIDCHNRPTHLFETPAKETDSVLQRQADLRALPFYKREVVKAASVVCTHELGVAGVRDAINKFYATTYPEIAPSRAPWSRGRPRKRRGSTTARCSPR
jgi:hypothetical protein